ncbi:hypothetical protein, partial [Salinivibrio kushneri]|uniref:hypothetical protein n=1 Tax=Salinivibrio kushneri TaxID=1908198 RepID=UPI001A7E0B9C
NKLEVDGTVDFTNKMVCLWEQVVPSSPFQVHIGVEKVLEAYRSIPIATLLLDQRSSSKARPLSAV